MRAVGRRATSWLRTWRTRRSPARRRHVAPLPHGFFQVRSEFEKLGAPLTPFMCGVSRLWQRLDKLAEEAERERSEKEELRRANHLLQQRVEELSRGASSVPLAERVKPIVAPSPPKSLKGFRQVRRSVGRWRDGEDVSGII